MKETIEAEANFTEYMMKIPETDEEVHKQYTNFKRRLEGIKELSVQLLSIVQEEEINKLMEEKRRNLFKLVVER